MKWAATLAVAAAAVGLTSGQCTGGFTCVGKKCLYFMIPTGTWTEQRGICQLMSVPDPDLATVTGDLHNAIYQYIMDDTSRQGKCVWLGGSDASSEGSWTWVHDGTAIADGGPHWDPCEPEPDGGYTENYLAICPNMYYFKDYPGDNNGFYAICQDFNVTTCS